MAHQAGNSVDFSADTVKIADFREGMETTCILFGGYKKCLMLHNQSRYVSIFRHCSCGPGVGTFVALSEGLFVLDFNLHPYIIVDRRDRGDLHLTINKNNSAFTLIELMIVIAIMAILSAIALPNYQNFMAQKRLNGASREVYGNLSAARMQSINENKWIALNIDNDHQYTMFRDNNMNGTVDTGESIIMKDLHPAYYDVTFSSSSGTVIVFYPNGTGSTGTLGLTGSTGAKSITISSAGRIKIN